jgi:murein DD-endopeptidase MepM/ murein hydrolase activator NlpD
VRSQKNYHTGRDFLHRYSIKKISTFFVTSNLIIIFACLTQNRIVRHRLITNLDLDLNHAITTFEEHGAYINQLPKLREDFINNNNNCIITVSSIDVASQKLDPDVQLARKLLGKGDIKLYHKEKFLLATLAKGKVTHKVYKYNGGMYDASGTRLDAMETMLKPLELITPLPGKKLRISSKYGYRLHPIRKTHSFHAGIDVAAPKKSKIHAALDGVIKLTAYNRGYGTYIIVQHRNKLQTLYAHLDSINPKIRIGKKVKKGDILGDVGRTGTATAPHLHFETRIDGKHVNPISIKPMKYQLTGIELKNFKLHRDCIDKEVAILGSGIDIN